MPDTWTVWRLKAALHERFPAAFGALTAGQTGCSLRNGDGASALVDEDSLAAAGIRSGDVLLLSQAKADPQAPRVAPNGAGDVPPFNVDSATRNGPTPVLEDGSITAPCRACNQAMPAGATYCSNCGSRLREDTPARGHDLGVFEFSGELAQLRARLDQVRPRWEADQERLQRVRAKRLEDANEALADLGVEEVMAEVNDVLFDDLAQVWAYDFTAAATAEDDEEASEEEGWVDSKDFTLQDSVLVRLRTDIADRTLLLDVEVGYEGDRLCLAVNRAMVDMEVQAFRKAAVAVLREFLADPSVSG